GQIDNPGLASVRSDFEARHFPAGSGSSSPLVHDPGRHANCIFAQLRPASILTAAPFPSFIPAKSSKQTISHMNPAGPDLLIAVLHRVRPSMSLPQRADLIVDTLLHKGADLRKPPALEDMKLLLLRVMRFGRPRTRNPHFGNTNRE